MFCLENIIIISKSQLEYIKLVCKVLHLLSDAIVTVYLKKCSLSTNIIDYLGNATCTGKLKIEMYKFEAIHNLKEPRNMSELQLFMGFSNAFCRFVQDFTHIASPFNKLRKNQPQSFDNLNDGKETHRKLYRNDWYVLRFSCLLVPKTDTPSILMPETDTSMPSNSKNSLTYRQNQ